MRLVMLIALAGTLFLSGCARYARNLNTLYEPSTTVRGGAGEIVILIPENQQTRSPDIKWVLGKVLDGKKNKIDEISSQRSQSEIIQSALEQELKRAGYSTTSSVKRTVTGKLMIDLTKSEISIEQISDLADMKATCHILVAFDVFKNNLMLKRLQYQAKSSKTDIRDRDVLAREVMQEALQSVMMSAVPDLHNLLKE